MRDLVEFIAKQLVSKPESVFVEETEESDFTNLSLKVDPEDMGQIIGRSGQTIKAIRKLLLIRAISEGKKVNLHLAEPEGERGGVDLGAESTKTFEVQAAKTPESTKTPEMEVSEEVKAESKSEGESEEKPKKTPKKKS